MGDGRGLQAVELVEHAVDRRVRDEVEHVLGLGGALLLRLVGEGGAAGEAVVHLADEVRVAEGLAAELGGQLDGELAEVREVGADVDVLLLVHQDAEEGLGGACVLDGLGGEEN